MFYDTSRYLDDIFTIDNPEFEKYIPDIYPTELQLNKANTSDKETSFLDLNIKVIGSDVHSSVFDKRDDFGFTIVNFPWLSGYVPRLPSYGVHISQLVRFARYCTSVSDFNSKNLQITFTGAASQAGGADYSRAPGLTSGLQGSMNVDRGALLLVPQ